MTVLTLRTSIVCLLQCLLFLQICVQYCIDFDVVEIISIPSIQKYSTISFIRRIMLDQELIKSRFQTSLEYT